MNLVIKNVNVYAPQYCGLQDILIINGRISAIEKSLLVKSLPFSVQEIDGREKFAVPGLIDQHIHLIGGGGEGGFSSMTPETPFSKIIKAGLTTVCGVLGTDGINRSLYTLLAKTRALREQGITAYMYTGSYKYPSKTITQSVQEDIVILDTCIGVKVALNDHRASNITVQELIRLAQEARVGGMQSGKAGVVHIHMGEGRHSFDVINEAVAQSDTPIHHFRPTHISRTRPLLEEAKKFAKNGGYIDFTSGMDATPENRRVSVLEGIRECIEEGINRDLITVSSDGQGSVPVYDSQGKYVDIGIGKFANIEVLQNMIRVDNWKLEDALPFFTRNLAQALCLPQKGTLGVGCDGDVVILDNDYEISSVIAQGKIMFHNKELLVKGQFED